MSTTTTHTNSLSFFASFFDVLVDAFQRKVNLPISTLMRHSTLLSLERVSKTINFFTKRLRICVDTTGGHKKHGFEALSSVFKNSFSIFDIITFLYSVTCF